ncbi:MAG: hypothetical protein WCK42_06250 [Myxococcaceae bacterium]
MIAFKSRLFLVFLCIISFSLDAQTAISDQLKLCTASGYELVSINSIERIEVVLYEIGKPEFRIEFTDSSITKLLNSLNLDTPIEIGSPATILTGKVILYFQSRSKTLNIGNHRVLQDEQCPDVLYFPNSYLDYSWLPTNRTN